MTNNPRLPTYMLSLLFSLILSTSAIPHELQPGFEPLIPRYSSNAYGVFAELNLQILDPDFFCDMIFGRWVIHLSRLTPRIMMPIQATEVVKLDFATIRTSCLVVRSAAERIQALTERREYYSRQWFGSDWWRAETNMMGWWDLSCPLHFKVVESARTNKLGTREPYAICQHENIVGPGTGQVVEVPEVHKQPASEGRADWERDPSNRWPQYVRFNDMEAAVEAASTPDRNIATSSVAAAVVCTDEERALETIGRQNEQLLSAAIASARSRYPQ